MAPTRGFQIATETPVIREEGTPVLPPPGLAGAVGIGNGPAILSKFMVSSFKMSMFDKARLFTRHDITAAWQRIWWDGMWVPGVCLNCIEMVTVCHGRCAA